MENTNGWNPALHEPMESVHGDPAALAAARDCAPPYPTKPPAEDLKPMQVSGNSVVLVVTRSDPAEPSTYRRDRVMTAAFQLRFYCLELRYQPLLRRLAPHDERSIFPPFPTVVREARNVKISGFPSPRCCRF